MLRDITIGQYYEKESIIHKLDPRLKFIATMVYMISVFCFSRFVGLMVCFLYLAFIIKLSKVPVKFIVRGLKPLAVLLIFTMGIHILCTDGYVLFHYGIITVTLEGIRKAFFMVFRMCLLVFGASMMTFTTTPNQLTDAMEKIFRPLNRVKIPVHEMAMMMSIALRFIPILLEETDKIMKAQTARGADFETGGIMKKAKAMLPLLVPLFVAAFRRANDLAMAMEARCYRGGKGRTKMRPLKYHMIDILGYFVVLLYIVTLIEALHYLPTIWSVIPYPVE